MLVIFKEWLPLTVSAGALLVSAIFGWTSQSDRRSAARLSREKDLHTWSRDVGDIYEALLAGDEPAKARAVARLSVLIDYGRLMFPNDLSQVSHAFPKGLRSSVLDPLVATKNRCQVNIPTDARDQEKLLEDWREFTDQLSSRTTAFAISTSPEAQGKPQYRNP